MEDDKIRQLEAELAKANAELALLKLQLQDCKVDSPQVAPAGLFRPRDLRCRFLEMPKELREHVYSFLLGAGEVWVRHRSSALDGDIRFQSYIEGSESRPWQPQTQLFLVSKAIKAESMDYYFTNNTFNLMGPDLHVPYSRLLPEDDIPIHTTDMHIRNLSIAFDLRACDINTTMWNTLDYLDLHEEDERSDLVSWRQTLHDRLMYEVLHRTWYVLIHDIHKLKLRRLEINFQNCYCPCGCQRLVEQVMEEFLDVQAIAEPLAVTHEIKFLGTKSIEERTFLKQMAGKIFSQPAPRIVFSGVFEEKESETASSTWSKVDERHEDPTAAQQTRILRSATF